VIKIDNNRYGIVIVDISGHGSSAAIVMSVISFVVHSVIERVKDTAELVTILNNHIFERLGGEKYATGIFLIYDTKKEVFQYTNAGHCAILVYNKKQDKIIELSKGGAPVGVMENLRYEKETFKFNKGDIVLLETDGVYETMNENDKLFTMERVKQLLLNYKDKRVKEINQYILMDIAKFRGQVHQNDDITLVSLKKEE
ncbi:MAG: serine/threonine-protein phosphatase, partial [Spirochaetes bacterium]|nr:serine/threonine-protein phosphatase [Spirochaetota bacterium]